MDTLNVTIKYRPVRVGWCIRANDKAAFRKAAEINFTLWGGFYNPIIPVDDDALAESLVRLFRVDCLYPITSDTVITGFIEKHPHLKSPLERHSIFASRPDMNGPLLVDNYLCWSENKRHNTFRYGVIYPLPIFY